MKKLGVLFSSLVLLAVPTVSLANINTLDGLNATGQFLATTTATTTMHMKIVSAGTTHTFQWDATPWRVDQGGTGTTTYVSGSLLFYTNNKITEDNGNLFWSTINKFLGIGTSAPTEKLEVAGNVKLSGTLFANSLNIIGTSTLSGRVGIGNTNPQHALDVSGAMYSRLVTTTSVVDWSAGNVQSITLNTSSTTLVFSNPQAGGEYKLILNQDGTGGRTVTWPATNVKWPSGSVTTLTSASNSTDMASFVYDGSNYLGTFNSNYKTASAPQIALDTSKDCGSTSPCSYTVTGSFLIVEVSNCSSDGVTGVTYNGVPMVLAFKATVLGCSTGYTFYLLNPSTGTNNIVVSGTMTGMVATSYSGVSLVDATSTASLDCNTLSQSITPVLANTWAVWGVSNGDTAPTAISNVTFRTTQASAAIGIGDSNGTITAGAGYTMQANCNGTAGVGRGQGTILTLAP